MEESVDLHEDAGKENEQTLANLSPAEEATSKDEVEIVKFWQEQKSKNTFLFSHIINILLTELGRSVWENLDLGRWSRPAAFGLYWRPRSRFPYTDLPLG